MIDGPTKLRVGQIVPGVLGGSLRMSVPAGKNTPGLTTNAELSFTLRGALPQGGIITVVLPAGGWTMNASFPQIAIGADMINGSWSSFNRTLQLVTPKALSTGQALNNTLMHVVTPLSELAEATGTITTHFTGGLHIIDGPTEFKSEEISRGKLSGELRFTVAKTSPPGSVTNARVSFITAGPVFPGGTIKIVLPMQMGGQW